MDCKSIELLLSFEPISGNLAVGIVGSSSYLGSWHKPLKMHKIGWGKYAIALYKGGISDTDEFKFVVFCPESGDIVRWEEGENRVFSKSDIANGKIDFIFRGHREYRASGVAIPVFSLRRQGGWGVGELTDLMMLADWCRDTGQKFIQILPINDTNATLTDYDSYPYNIISIYAINPIYLNLQELFDLYNIDCPKEFEKISLELDILSELNYAKVYSLKIEVARFLYDRCRIYLSKCLDFQKFVLESAWLRSYSVFCFLRDKYGSADFSKWNEYAEFSQKKIENFIDNHREQIEFYYFIQYHLFRQLDIVRKNLKSQSIALKGDLPIGIGRYSVESWQYPHLFNTEEQAGAPPDFFAEEGQVWGFPTYNWDEMKEDGYAWWLSRFEAMERIYDALRIDHILGFFRIWEVPLPFDSGLLGHFNESLPLSMEEIFSKTSILIGKENTLYCQNIGDVIHSDFLFLENVYQSNKYDIAINAKKSRVYSSLSDSQKQAFDVLYDDYFYHRHNEFWKDKAIEKLSKLLSNNSMLICGEDLGMIPHSVPEVMEQLGILSLEILRMPKRVGERCVNASTVPYRSVISTSTHDTSTLRGWWREDKEMIQQFYNQYLCLQGEVPKELAPDIAQKIVTLVLNSPSMLAIIPLQDWLAIDKDFYLQRPEEERINVPSNSRHIWRWRMPVDLDTLKCATRLNEEILRIIKHTNR